MTKLLQFLDGLILYIFISGILSLGLATALPTWRKNLGAILLSMVTGALVGYGVESLPKFASWSIIASILGTFFAMPFALWTVNGGDMKTLASDIIEVGREIRKRQGDTVDD